MPVTAGSTFFQVAATILATLLISGVLAEIRGANSRAVPALGWLSIVLWGLTWIAVAFGELLCLNVLLGRAPIGFNQTAVEICLLVASVSVFALSSFQFALGDPVVDRGRASWGRLAGIFLPAFLAVVAAVFIVHVNARQVEVVSVCPGAPPGSPFTGVVASPLAGPARVRRSAGIDAPILRRYASGCPLGFKGYCLGQPVADFRAPNLPDGRWFILKDETGLIASAVVDGDPPARMRPQNCRGALPPPSDVALLSPSSGKLSGTVSIVATAVHTPYIGIAAWYPDTLNVARTPYRWHYVGTISTGNSGGFVSWDTRPVPGVRVVIGAVACEAVNDPTSVADSREYIIKPVASAHLTAPPVSPLGPLQAAACGSPD